MGGNAGTHRPLTSPQARALSAARGTAYQRPPLNEWTGGRNRRYLGIWLLPLSGLCCLPGHGDLILSLFRLSRLSGRVGPCFPLKWPACHCPPHELAVLPKPWDHSSCRTPSLPWTRPGASPSTTGNVCPLKPSSSMHSSLSVCRPLRSGNPLVHLCKCKC